MYGFYTMETVSPFINVLKEKNFHLCHGEKAKHHKGYFQHGLAASEKYFSHQSRFYPKIVNFRWQRLFSILHSKRKLYVLFFEHDERNEGQNQQ